MFFFRKTSFDVFKNIVHVSRNYVIYALWLYLSSIMRNNNVNKTRNNMLHQCNNIVTKH